MELVVIFFAFLGGGVIGEGVGETRTITKIIEKQRICVKQEYQGVKHEDCWKLVRE